MLFVAFLSIRNYYADFAIQEVTRVAELFGIQSQSLFSEEKITGEVESFRGINFFRNKNFRNFPYLILNLPNLSVAKSIGNRCIFIKRLFLLFSCGKSLKELIFIDQETMNSYLSSESTFTFEISRNNKAISQEERIALLSQIKAELSLDIQGKVDIKNAEREFRYEEHYENSESEDPLHIYFGILISKFLNVEKEGRSLEEYSLKDRAYLGPTSTDHTLAFSMVNFAHVQKGNFVYDPFCGTGSLLIASSHFEALTFGSDIDIRVLQGYSVGRENENSIFAKENKEVRKDIFVNFEQYGLFAPEIIRMDCSSPSFTSKRIFDAIITDPPYGHRAGARSSGSKKETLEEKKADFIPFNKISSYESLLDSLFSIADATLKANGTLTFLFPYKKENADDSFDMEKIPYRENYALVKYSINPTSKKKFRFLLTYIKLK